jgi:hypothetical protein
MMPMMGSTERKPYSTIVLGMAEGGQVPEPASGDDLKKQIKLDAANALLQAIDAKSPERLLEALEVCMQLCED